MPSATEDLTIDDPPKEINPYEVLGVTKEATPKEITSAYRKLALKHHPDKADRDGRDAAHHKFQGIAFAYAILSDATRRRRYDTTGNTSESITDADDFDWLAFYRTEWDHAVMKKQMADMKAEYQGSEKEEMDLLAAYKRYKGNLNKIFETIMLSEVLEDEERFRVIIDAAIEKGEVDAYKDYVNEPESKRRQRWENANKEADGAKEYAKELGIYEPIFGTGEKTVERKTKKSKQNGAPADESLMALFQNRQKRRAEQSSDFLDRLEEKYAGQDKKGKAKRRRVVEEPPEELFENNRQRGKVAKGAEGNAKSTKGTRNTKKVVKGT